MGKDLGRDYIEGALEALHEINIIEPMWRYVSGTVGTKVLVMNKSEIYMYDTVENVFAQSEKLLKIGLDIPEISQVFLKLRKLGYPIRSDIYTIQQAQSELLSILK